MSDTKNLSELIIILGLMIIFSQALYGDIAGPISFSAFSETPVFDNPFDRGLTFNFGFTNAGNNGPGNDFDDGYDATFWGTAFGSDNSCSQSEYWNCIIDPNGPDQNETFYQITNALVLNTTGWPSTGKVRYGTLTLICRSNVTNAVPMAVLLNSWIPSSGGTGIVYLQNSGENVYCRSGISSFTTSIVHLEPGFGIVVDLSVNPTPGNLLMEIFGLNAQISTVILTVFISNSSSCSGTDFFSSIGCSISQFFQQFINWLTWFINGVSWVIAWLLVAINFVLAVFTSVLWFYSVPNMPIFFQAIISVIVSAILFLMIYSIAKLVRGNPGV